MGNAHASTKILACKLSLDIFKVWHDQQLVNCTVFLHIIRVYVKLVLSWLARIIIERIYAVSFQTNAFLMGVKTNVLQTCKQGYLLGEKSILVSMLIFSSAMTDVSLTIIFI